ncbi:MAG TPA: helix-turn-helix transcriptional regulator [Candidatus Limiplasma sp.]|nr:helix-turn-helix transcriptional regulator [Candidatus Limiplasma sp.]HRX08737.1 helix-turn-helix transcriptional regulator [Candidatus Limiplasma sp.]
MSRLGDLLKTERLRRDMTLKQVSRLSGVSADYLKAVEEGKKIIPDDQARRILKKIGMTEQTEQGFTLDDIAATVDLQTVQPKAESRAQQRADAVPAFTDAAKQDDTVQGSVWLDALQSVLKRVPVVNAVMEEIDHRLLPVLQGRIEGASPDKVFYYKVPDDGMRGFRILKDDLCFIVPAASPIDGAVMLVERKGMRMLCKVKKLDSLSILLQSYDREYTAEPCALPDIAILGHVVRVEFTLPE